MVNVSCKFASAHDVYIDEELEVSAIGLAVTIQKKEAIRRWKTRGNRRNRAGEDGYVTFSCQLINFMSIRKTV